MSHLIFELDAVDLQECHGRMCNVRSGVVRDDSETTLWYGGELAG
jgi:hypothetical protein